MTTLRNTTVGRTLLDESSARRRDPYLTTHNTTDIYLTTYNTTDLYLTTHNTTDLYLTTHNTTDLYLTHNTHKKQPCPLRDSNPKSQQASGRKPTQ